METHPSRRRFIATTGLTVAGFNLPLFPASAGGAKRQVEETSALTVPPGSADASDAWTSDTPELVATALNGLPPVPAGPFQESWESIARNYSDPDWFRDAKFGIMMHWGIYSVPAHASEWYVRYMYGGNADVMRWHTEHFGPPTQFGYKDFLPRFTAANWDPDGWAQLFSKAGAKYVLAPGEHHDGFSNWDSAINPFNAKNYGPKRDLDGELIVALRKVGLRAGISDHSAFHFAFIPPLPGSDQYDPKWAAFYSVADRSHSARVKFMHDWVAKRLETIETYQPDMLWFDMNTDHTWDPLKIRVAAHYYNRARQWKRDVAISAKQAAWVSGQVMDYEREGRAPMELTDWIWQPDDPIMDKFGYVEGLKPYPPEQFIYKIIENVSKNGNLLLNISPRADGTIPQEQQDVLLAIGRWLEINGEAIYSSRPWIRYGEGPVAQAAATAMAKIRANGFAGRLNGQNLGGDGVSGGGLSKGGYSEKDIRFTRRGDVLYAIVMNWPAQASVTIGSLAPGAFAKGEIERVELLGHGAPLPFKRDSNGLVVTFPAERPCDHAYALRIEGLTLTQT